jgi:hypothetical protein
MIRLPVIHAVHEILHVDIGIIQARDLGEAFAAGVLERLLTFFANFLEGLETIRRESGAHDQEVLGSLGRQGFETLVGIR